MDEIRQELELLKQRIRELEAKISRYEPEPEHRPINRRNLVGGAVTGVLGAAMLTGGARTAAAADGSPIVGGAVNFTTSSTSIVYPLATSIKYYAFGVLNFDVVSNPATSTIFGFTDGAFNYALGGYDTGGVGVSFGGVNGTSQNNAGVVGVSPGTGAGAMGVLAQGAKLGLKATAAPTDRKNVAIWASAGNEATALAADGMLRLKEAGHVIIQAGQSSKIILSPGTTDTTSALGFAMIQSPVSGFSVTGVSLENWLQGRTSYTRITISLNAPAPAGGLKIGWCILHQMSDVLT